jgi:hypothetical protein
LFYFIGFSTICKKSQINKNSVLKYFKTVAGVLEECSFVSEVKDFFNPLLNGHI